MMELSGSRPLGNPTPMSLLFLCFSPGSFRTTCPGSLESIAPGTVGYLQKNRAPHSMKYQIVSPGSKLQGNLLNSKPLTLARFGDCWKVSAKISESHALL